MTKEERQNALRSVAKRCNAELKQAIAINPKAPKDPITRPIILKHFESINPMFRLADLLWEIGVLNRQFKER